MTVQCVMTKYHHTHMAFIEELNKLLAEKSFQGLRCTRDELSRKGVEDLGQTFIWIGRPTE